MVVAAAAAGGRAGGGDVAEDVGTTTGGAGVGVGAGVADCGTMLLVKSAHTGEVKSDGRELKPPNTDMPKHTSTDHDKD